MKRAGRALDLGLAALFAAQLGASAWLVSAGDRVTLPGHGALPGACWFRDAFALDCPFCGMTRSFVALAHGELGAALRFHPAGPLLFAFMVITVIAALAVWIRRSPPLVERARFLRAFQAIAVICVMIGFVKMVRS